MIRSETIDRDSGPATDGRSADDVAARTVAVLRARVQAAPYFTLGAAIGLGIVAGGGAWRPLAGSLFRLGARFALTALVPAMIDRIDLSPHYQSEDEK